MTADELFLDFAKRADVDIETCERELLVSLAKTAFAIATHDLLNPLRVASISAGTVTTSLQTVKVIVEELGNEFPADDAETVQDAIQRAMRQQSIFEQLLAKSLATMGED